MRAKEIMIANRDTTVWSGVSLLLALGIPSEVLSQVALVVLGPAGGWLTMYFTKKIVAYLEEKWKIRKTRR